MLTVDPRKRITAVEALNHPWIGQRETVASHEERLEIIPRLKEFNSARRRFKASVYAVIAAQRNFGEFSTENSIQESVNDANEIASSDTT